MVEDDDRYSEEFGYLIHSESYEEDGALVTEKIYFLPDTDTMSVMSYDDNCNAVVPMGESGRGTLCNLKTHTYASGNVMSYTAAGYFMWGGYWVSVLDPSGGVSWSEKPSSLPYNKVISSGSCGINGDWAYVTHSFSVDNYFKVKQNFSVTVKVNVNGKKK